MKLEDQVCSLELAKRLKELGVKQESLFYWYKDSIDIDEFNWELGVVAVNIQEKEALHGFGYGKRGLDVVHGLRDFNAAEPDYVSAFTVAELGVMLGPILPALRDYGNSERIGDCWKATLPEGGEYTLGLSERVTEANARAKMLVYLLENDLLANAPVQ